MGFVELDWIVLGLIEGISWVSLLCGGCGRRSSGKALLQVRREEESLLQRLAHGNGIASDGAHAPERTGFALEHVISR